MLRNVYKLGVAALVGHTIETTLGWGHSDYKDFNGPYLWVKSHANWIILIPWTVRPKIIIFINSKVFFIGYLLIFFLAFNPMMGFIQNYVKPPDKIDIHGTLWFNVLDE